MPDQRASGRATRARTRRARRAGAHIARRGIGLALAGGGPLGGIYEVGALLALADSLDGLDFNDLDVYVGVSSGGFVAAALANGISPAQMYRLFIDDGADAALKPEIFLKPAFAEFAPLPCARCPALALRATLQYLRDPFHRGVMESFATLVAGDPDRRVRQPRDRRLPGAPVRGARAHQRFSQARAQAVPRRDQSRHRRLGDVRRAPARDHVPISRAIEASSALPGLFPPVAIDGEHYVDGALNKTLHASVALDEGVDAPAVRQSAGAVRRERGAARAARADRRQAEPGRPAAGAVADVPRDHPFADAGRHGEVPPRSTRTPTSCCSSPTARTPTCSSPTSSATGSASACARSRSPKTRQASRARATSWRRCSRATASRSAHDRLADPHAHVADALTDPRPLHARSRADADRARRPRASSRHTLDQLERYLAARCRPGLARRPGWKPPLRRTHGGAQTPAPHARAHPRDQPRAVQPRRRAAHHDGGHRRRDEHQPGQPLLPLPQQGRHHRRAVRRVRGAASLRCSPSADDRAPDVEDLWFLLHVLFERMRDYRFLYRDLDEITSRNRKLAQRFADLLRRCEATVIELCRSLVRAGTMRATEREIGALAPTPRWSRPTGCRGSASAARTALPAATNR